MTAPPPGTPALASGDEMQPGDAYWDGPLLVFTEQYHLRRGYCCNSGCRHCPYRGEAGE
jgi:hypothetical protein